MIGNAVRFVYVSSGSIRPTPVDPDAIYFLEGEKQLYVGNALIADSVEPVDVERYLAPYLVKDIKIEGSGQVISDAVLDSETGKIVFHKSDVNLTKGTTPESERVNLSPGAEFSTLSSTSVDGTTITDNVIRFKLPVQITSIDIKRYDSGSSKLSLEVTSSDGTVSTKEIEIFGSAAFMDASEFATREQGAKADAAMPRIGGSATDAAIRLANDPVDSMDAVTKQYVDSSISKLGTVLHYRGNSSTPITNGGREEPTIEGESIDPTQGMTAGDVVTYDGKEFVWNGTSWQQFGDEGSYALRNIRVDGGAGLEGGGTLDSNITISHAITGTGSAESYVAPGEGTSVISGIDADEFGHIQNVHTTDITSDIEAAVRDAIGDNIPEYSVLGIDDVSGKNEKIYVLTKDGTAVGDSIEIPKVSIIKSSAIRVVEEPDVPYEGAVPGDKYVDFTTGDGESDHIYIPATDIGAVYDGGAGITINGTTISHSAVGDASALAVINVANDSDTASTGVLVIRHDTLERDGLGHVVQQVNGPSEYELLTKEKIEEMVSDAEFVWS